MSGPDGWLVVVLSPDFCCGLVTAQYNFSCCFSAVQDVFFRDSVDVEADGSYAVLRPQASDVKSKSPAQLDQLFCFELLI